MNFIQGRNRYIPLALKMFRVTFSLNFPASLVASTRACHALISTLWVHTGWPGHVQMREEGRERERESSNSRTGYCSLLPVLSGLNHYGSFFFLLVSSSTATCLSISTSFHKPPTETPATHRPLWSHLKQSFICLRTHIPLTRTRSWGQNLRHPASRHR